MPGGKLAWVINPETREAQSFLAKTEVLLHTPAGAE
jgi:hypothetical protein